MSALSDEILSDLTTELGLKDNDEMAKLSIKVKNAEREVKRARNYPNSYTDKMIEEDLYNYYSNIKDLALYDYNQIGAEGESEHLENSINRKWVNRNSLFNGVFPVGKIF